MTVSYILIAFLIALVVIKLSFFLNGVNHTGTSFVRSFFRFYPQHRIYTTSTLAKSRFMKASNTINIIMFLGLIILICIVVKYG